MGDAVEALGTSHALCPLRTHALPIGSAKPNIGHAEAAAGLVGLLRAALAVRAAVLPATLHFRRPHPNVPLHVYGLRVLTTAEPWGPAADTASVPPWHLLWDGAGAGPAADECGPHSPEAASAPASPAPLPAPPPPGDRAGARAPPLRIAGVTALGLGGSNAHAVLGTPPPLPPAAPRPPPGPGPLLLVLSAPAFAALRALVETYVRRLRALARGPAEPALALAGAICRTAARHRGHWRCRTFACGRSPGALAAALVEGFAVRSGTAPGGACGPRRASEGLWGPDVLRSGGRWPGARPGPAVSAVPPGGAGPSAGAAAPEARRLRSAADPPPRPPDGPSDHRLSPETNAVPDAACNGSPPTERDAAADVPTAGGPDGAPRLCPDPRHGPGLRNGDAPLPVPHAPPPLVVVFPPPPTTASDGLPHDAGLAHTLMGPWLPHCPGPRAGHGAQSVPHAVLQVAALEALRDRGLRPSVVCGWGSGGVAALYAVGAFDWDEAVHAAVAGDEDAGVPPPTRVCRAVDGARQWPRFSQPKGCFGLPIRDPILLVALVVCCCWAHTCAHACVVSVCVCVCVLCVCLGLFCSSRGVISNRFSCAFALVFAVPSVCVCLCVCLCAGVHVHVCLSSLYYHEQLLLSLCWWSQSLVCT